MKIRSQLLQNFTEREYPLGKNHEVAENSLKFLIQLEKNHILS